MTANAITISLVLTVLGVVSYPLGILLDHWEYRYGRPARLALRWEHLGIFAALPLLIVALVAMLIGRMGAD